MSADADRRRFLFSAAAGGALLGLEGAGVLSGLRPVSAAEARLDANVVRLTDDIEPLVQLLENTPRGELVEQVAARVQRGLNYRDLLAALLLAGVRNVEPRPSVGFKFHAVLVVNSAHLASLSSPAADRWLPIFWALDYFKSSQARDVQEGNWTMPPVDESKVPPGHRAEAALRDALDRWDEEAADAAVAGCARSMGANQLFEIFARYGARDFRSIGHKAIFVANGWRTLNSIGWRHAEPVLRSLAYALLNHGNEPNPADSDLDADRPWRRNQELAARIRPSWRDGEASDEATREMLATLRQGSDEDASRMVVEQLNRGVAAQSIYDALFLGAGELLMRQRGIVALHAVTSTNALYYAFTTAGDDDTRRLLLLQNAAFLPLFREAMRGRGAVRDGQLDELEDEAVAEGTEEAVAEIFADVSGSRDAAARKVLAFVHQGRDPRAVVDAARQLIFLKGTDSHDYKFSSAVLEDFYHVSPRWRPHYLASSVYQLRGSKDRDNGLVGRIRSAFQA